MKNMEILQQIINAWKLPSALRLMMGDYCCDIHQIETSEYNLVLENFIPSKLTNEDLKTWALKEVARRGLTYEKGDERRAEFDMLLAHAQECKMKYNWATFYLMLYDACREKQSTTCTAPIYPMTDHTLPEWKALSEMVHTEYLAAAKRTFQVLGWEILCIKTCTRPDWKFDEAFSEPHDGYLMFNFDCIAGNVYLEASVTFECYVGECVPAIFSAKLKSAMVPLTKNDKSGTLHSRRVRLHLDRPKNAHFTKRCTFAFESETVQADLFCQHCNEEDLDYLLYAINVLNAATCVEDTDVLFIREK